MYWFNLIDGLLKDTNEYYIIHNKKDIPRAKFIINLLEDRFKFNPVKTIMGWFINVNTEGYNNIQYTHQFTDINDEGYNHSIHLREFLQETLPKEIEDELNENLKNMNIELDEVNLLFKREKKYQNPTRKEIKQLEREQARNPKAVGFKGNFCIPELKDRHIIYDKFLHNINLDEDDKTKLEDWLKIEMHQRPHWNSALSAHNVYFYNMIEKDILERYNSEKYVRNKNFITKLLNQFNSKKSVDELLECIKDIQDAKLLVKFADT